MYSLIEYYVEKYFLGEKMKKGKVILLIFFLVVSITLFSCKNENSSGTKNNYNKIDKS